MSDKIFEERVKAEFHNFGLRPDATVWAEVEASLQPKRKKRVIVWFLLFGLLFGVGFLAYQTTHHSVENSKDSIAVKANAKTGSQKRVLLEGKENGAAIELGEEADNKTKISKQPIIQLGQFYAKPSFEKPLVNENNATSTPILLGNTAANKQSLEASQSLQPELVLVHLKEDKSDSIPTSLKDTLAIVAKLNSDSSSGKKEHKSNPKWQWSVAATAGISVLRSGLFTGDKTYDIAQYIGNFNSIPSSAISFSKPNTTSAKSYDISIQLEKMIRKQMGLQFGVGYTLYQNHISVGTKVATTPSTALRFLADNAEKSAQDGFYYYNGEQNEYTNQYHFLHFSTSAFKLLQLTKLLSIRMNIGLMGSYLFASNGLHYITGKDVLVKNNSLLNKWQTGAIASVEMGIGKKPWIFLGPEFRYQFTNLSVLSGTSQHLGLAGIRLRINLPQKIKSVQR